MRPPAHLLYDAAGARELDRLAIEVQGVPGPELMQRAGVAAARWARFCWPRAIRVCVLCGPGNNGGDGYVLARRLHEQGLKVQVIAALPAASPDCRANAERLQAAGLPLDRSDASPVAGTELIVDALFGTGLERPLDGPPARLVAEANATVGAARLALDLPSGLHADSGAELGAGFRATRTLAFLGYKLGMFTGAGPRLCGKTALESLGFDESLRGRVSPRAHRWGGRDRHPLPPAPIDLHKGGAGRVLVVGGDSGMSGAAALAAGGALRGGAGLVRVATRAAHAASSVFPVEALCFGSEDAAALATLARLSDVLAVGPGLGQDAWGRQAWATALDCGRPMVVDADALNLLAREPMTRHEWILTPHPGEAARLLACPVTAVQADRPAAVRELVARYGGTVILKGRGSLVAGGAGGLVVVDAGHPGMASGGSGDLLTGLVAALWARTGAALEAARHGAWLHALAGEVAGAECGSYAMLAGDLLAALPQVLRTRS
ncbi:MAG: NAD(P)H-hydrate dehydratase [Gammaproteobacteria bacterium]|nr:NAD(P)H-hydrate dehydratase [Gammaproteobacteria bacterium]